MILRLERDLWQIDWTPEGIDSIRLRGADLLASKARPTGSPAAPWRLEIGREGGPRIRPSIFELTQSIVFPFRYEERMEVLVRGTNLMPFHPNVARELGAAYTVRLGWPSSEVAVSVVWDQDRLPSSSLRLKTVPPSLELALGGMSDRQVRPESWWVELRDGNAGRLIEVVSYDPAWPAHFEDEKGRIVQALGTLLAVLEHGGSTAVPGLAAKPVIDMWALLRGPLGSTEIRAMGDIGYEHFGEYGIAGRDYFVKSSPPFCHLHCYPEGHPDWNRHIAFRDWLRANPHGAQAYGELKRALALRFSRDRAAYTEAKSDFIESVVAGKWDQRRA